MKHPSSPRPPRPEPAVSGHQRLPQKGLGAQSNPAPRYLPQTIKLTGAAEQQLLAHKAVTVTRETPRSILTKNRSPDLPFDRSINPYRGCEHGCIYCYARPTHAYLDLSPGADFERQLFVKEGAAALLRRTLSTRGYQVAPIAIGTNTDPYQPIEGGYRVMRSLLEVLLEYRHPVSIVTKGTLVLRDVDLLTELASFGLVKVAISVTTLDLSLKTKLEPRTASPQRRLKLVSELSRAGVPTAAMVAPVIPFLNDHELESIVERCADAGARELNYILLRLPLEVAPLFEQWLALHFPERAERVLNAVRQTRGGELYQSRWGERMRGSGVVAKLLRQRFQSALRRCGLAGAALPRLRTDLFRPPAATAPVSAACPQGDLFGDGP